MKKFRMRLALLLSIVLCLSVFHVNAYSDDGDAITILKRAPVDIVFVMDTTGSMTEEIGAVKDNIKSFLDQLYNYNRRISETSDAGVGIDPRIALIDYKDIAERSPYYSTFHKRDDGSYWFVKTADIDDGDMLSAKLDDLVSHGISGGTGDGGETPTEALAKLYKADDGVADEDGFEWRSDAQKFVFLITDDYAWGRNHAANIPDMSEVITEFAKLNIQASVVTPSGAHATHYAPLYTGTGGKWYDLSGNLKFMEEIIEYFEKELPIPPVCVSVCAAGAPVGTGSVRLLRYMDKDGAEHKGPAAYCGDNPASVSVSLGSLVELEVNSNGTRNGAEDPDENTYVIDKLTVNGEPLDLSGSEISDYRIPGLEIRNDTIIQALFKKKKEPAVYIVVFDPNGGTPVSPQRLTEGETTLEPDTPERDGYEFNYWYLNDGNTPFDFSTPVLSDLTLTASWNLIEKEEE
ncbi:MAG: InlB B-repeat-containing protein, partial [Lachnospiraceae bacterium]|nr:InlB B-repeat-containing protein [Lachnospiraceae bacterium]